MTLRAIVLSVAIIGMFAVSLPAHAFSFIFPIPNLAKPAPLNTLIDALEKSDETKAVAYVSEDKLFGSKYWVWGHFSGHVPQAEADRVAMSRCVASLANAKSQTAGGKSLYDYGAKACELYSFANKTVSPRAHEWQPVPLAAPQPPPPSPTPAASQPATDPSSQPAVVALPAAPASVPTESPAKPPTAASAPAPAGTAPSSQPQPQAQPATTESPTARKLRELEALRKEGLISDAEYQEKRKAILAAM